MKGLMKKDIELLMGNLRTYLLIAAIAFVYLFIGKGMEGFAVAYICMISGFLVLNTISYDDFEHGMSFLLVLPVSRKTYVREKYILSAVLCFCIWAAAVLAAGIRLWIGHSGQDWKEWIVTCIAYLVMIVILLLIMIPVQLRFGSENSRIVMIGAMISAAVIGFLVVKAIRFFGIDPEKVLNQLENWNPIWIILLICGILAVGIAASYKSSIRILEKKEF